MAKIIKKLGSNTISQIRNDDQNEFISVDVITSTWDNAVSLRVESKDAPGLRVPQFGALCAIRSFWTVSEEAATIVMPTGTGKTETMIAAVVSEQIKRTLIIVPSNLLRKQTVDRFVNFGILREMRIIDDKAICPTVCLLKAKPHTVDEFREILFQSSIVVTTMSLIKTFTDGYYEAINENIDTLIIDEAHHIAAKVWSTVKQKLSRIKCLQFTATPFRNDGKKVDGKIIYNYPLALAQKNRYFQPIQFAPVWEYDEENADRVIAHKAVEQLKKDIAANYNHIILVRAKDKKSADWLFNQIYLPLFSEYNPVLIHSDVPPRERNERLTALKSGKSRIVVCVDMFGEGIDIPSLKIAAMHDKYKSLPITLQFIGRFARSNSGLGPATFITNIANDDLSSALVELYSQDSDWNTLLPMLSSEAIQKEISLQELAAGFDVRKLNGISIEQIQPTISMTAYSVSETEWNLSGLHDSFASETSFVSVNQEKKLAVIITKVEEQADWTTYKGINNLIWKMYLVYWNPALKVCYINSDQKNDSDMIASVLFPSAKIVNGEPIFRCLSGINRLLLGTVGLKSAISGPIRYRMFAGLDIETGITQSQTETSFKSNLFGVGYEGKGQVSIGCSYKGRIWSRWVESIDYWMSWCDSIAKKVFDDSISTSDVLNGVLIQEIAQAYPESTPYLIEWPDELAMQTSDRIQIVYGDKTYSLFDLDINLEKNEEYPLCFSVSNSDFQIKYALIISNNSFSIHLLSSTDAVIKKGKKEMLLNEYFRNDTPQIRFADQSTLEGNILVKLRDAKQCFDSEYLIPWNWDGVDIQKESQGVERDSTSIQYRVIDVLKKNQNYAVIFDDDSSGEVADIVAIVDDDHQIQIHMFHCKYSHGEKAGSRVSDLYEVCGQAEKSVKWCSNVSALVDRLMYRETQRNKIGSTRFEVGNMRKLKTLKNKLAHVACKVEIVIVQPGVDSKAITGEMTRLLNGTASYILDTYGIKLCVICS